jgi:hypothetical protein
MLAPKVCSDHRRMTDEIPVARYAADMRRELGTTRPLERQATAGRMVRVRRGAYVEPEPWQESRPRVRHLLAVEAASRAARHQLVFSHESAAAIWRIPVVGDWPDAVHVVSGVHSRSSRPVIRHAVTLDPAEVRRWGRYLVTDPARTALDLAGTRPFVAGLAAIDHVRRHMGVTLEELERSVERRRPFRWARRTMRALECSSGLSDSALESVVIGRLIEHGFVVPEQQWEFVDSQGIWRRGDFRWVLPSGRVLAAEADGRDKYENPVLLAGKSPAQVLWEEKQREDDIRAMCSAFTRVYWSDAMGATGLIRKLERLGVPRV